MYCSPANVETGIAAAAAAAAVVGIVSIGGGGGGREDVNTAPGGSVSGAINAW